MAERLHFEREGRDWPNRSASRFVTAAGMRWHVQQMGDGPKILLLHGTGASTHSWAGLLPLLAERFSVTAVDLPGHGFTGVPLEGRLSLPGMSRAVGDLLRALDLTPELAAGHSAGAAILARMTLDGLIAPKAIISLNGAFLAFRGVAGHLFSPLAKMLALNPFVPWMLSWHASDRGVVEKLLRETGSKLDRRGVDLYARLFANSGHVAAALQMMASWNLRPLEQALPKLSIPLILVVANDDRTVPPYQAEAIAAQVPKARVVRVPRLGHLAHEENPAALAQVVAEIADEVRVRVP
jgi:magnesium chelatase accessory protein